MTNQEKLDEIYEMVKENNDILTGMRRRERVGNFLTIMYWLFLIAIVTGVIYYFKPVIDKLLISSEKIQSSFNEFENMRNNLPEAKVIKGVMDLLKKPE